MAFSKLSDFGDLIITGLSSTKLTDQDKRILEAVQPAGILFLKRNILQDVPYEDWLGEFSKLISDTLQYSSRKKMFLTIDHEGGKVQRAPLPVTNFGSPQEYQKRADQVAAAMAVELRTMGINLSWSPSVDINTNPENPIIGKLGRAFSRDPGEVAKAGVEFLNALEANGVIGCAKHFPGHGETWSDSHLELPVVSVDEATAIRRELMPFQAMIDAGVSCIMTAHVLFDQIDPKNPATFSHKFLTEILRKKMGYSGLIIADDINMLAIYDRIRTEDGVSDSVNAGVDSFIVGRFPDPEEDSSPILLAELLKQAVEHGKITESRLNESKERAKNLLKKIPMYKPEILDSSVLAKHRALLPVV